MFKTCILHNKLADLMKPKLMVAIVKLICISTQVASFADDVQKNFKLTTAVSLFSLIYARVQ